MREATLILATLKILANDSPVDDTGKEIKPSLQDYPKIP
jgi:hypothetical protein